MDWKKISIIVGLVFTLVGAVGAGAKWGLAYHNNIAKKCDVEAVAVEVENVSARLNQKILSDRIHNLQSRIWMLEDRYGGPGVPIAPSEIRNEYRQLQRELQQAKQMIRQMGG